MTSVASQNSLVGPSSKRRPPTSVVASHPNIYSPHEGSDCFKYELPSRKKAVGVIVTAFNEEDFELKRTLSSLERQAKIISEDGTALHVFLVLDGWKKSTESMKTYLKLMFPGNQLWSSLDNDSENVESLFFQNIKYSSEKTKVLSKVSISGKKSGIMYVTLMVKRDNRRKHNSLEWYFGRNGFAEFYKHELLLTTDCGSFFEDMFLTKMIRFMNSHPDVAVSCGRVRVMTREQQDSDESYFSTRAWFRACQQYGYESSYAQVGTAKSFFGYQDLPGPCSFFRAKAILGAVADNYAKFYHTDHVDIISGQFRGVEDCFLSYTSAFSTGKYGQIALAHDAFCYFDAQPTLESFVLQRKRWLLGVLASQISLFTRTPGMIMNTDAPLYRKLGVQSLLFISLINTIWGAVMGPASAISSLSRFVYLNFPEQQTALYIVRFLMIAMYLTTSFIHINKKFSRFFYVVAAVGVIQAIAMLYTQLHDLYESGGEGFLTSNFGLSFVPIVITALYHPSSLPIMLKSFLPHLMFTPTFHGWFGAYGFMRAGDLSWGNRPSEGITNFGTEDKEKTVKKINRQGLYIALAIVSLNMFFLTLIFQYGKTGFVSVLMDGRRQISILWYALALLNLVVKYYPRKIRDLYQNYQLKSSKKTN